MCVVVCVCVRERERECVCVVVRACVCVCDGQQSAVNGQQEEAVDTHLQR